jgi:hypothetical protein
VSRICDCLLLRLIRQVAVAAQRAREAERVQREAAAAVVLQASARRIIAQRQMVRVTLDTPQV